MDITHVMNLLRTNLPADCYKGINNVYIGQFDKLKKRDLTALHYNNNLYIDNHVESEKDLLDDLVHEFAHGFEEVNSEEDILIGIFDLVGRKMHYELNELPFGVYIMKYEGKSVKIIKH